MTWRDRGSEYDDMNDPTDPFGGRAGKPGGNWSGLTPTFDNPLSWSVPLFRISGIMVRIHVFFLLYIVIELGRGLVIEQAQTISFGLIALLMGVLFLIVLMHEFGHCIACRWIGGSADEILMWPLGGLAFCAPPHHWWPHFVTAAGGPMVNVILCLIIGPILGIITGDWLGTALPNPLNFAAASDQVFGPWSLLTLYSIHWISFILLLFNLLPIFPLDGGRLTQTLLWRTMGYSRSMRMAVYTGYIGAILLGLFGAITGDWMLLAIAIFGGVTCWMTIKQVKFTDEFMGFEGEYSAAYETPERETEPAKPSRAERKAEARAAKQQAASEAEAAEVERILQKISAVGMDGLSARERSTLQRATEKKQQDKP